MAVSVLLTSGKRMWDSITDLEVKITKNGPGKMEGKDKISLLETGSLIL